MTQVDVVMGGPGHEAVISCRSGQAMAAAARSAGHEVRELTIAERLDCSQLRPRAVVINIIHGTYGEDGTLQDELDAAGMVFIGSDSVASRLCMDKQACKQRLAEAGLAVPWGVRIDPTRMPALRDLKLPDLGAYVLKPSADGSSVGVRMIPNPGHLLPALEELVAELGPTPLLCEQRLLGAEYTVGLIERDGAWQALPPIRVAPAEGFYDFDAKYERNDTAYDFALSPELIAELQTIAEQSVRACACRDLARVDIMADRSGQLFVLEINTLPGFTDHSLVPKAAERIGLGMVELVDLLISNALQRMPHER